MENDILDKLGRSHYFTTLDLASGFHQIQMHPEDIENTAFSTENGHYELKRSPFGLKNAPSTFQRVMDNILRGLDICLVYQMDKSEFLKKEVQYLGHVVTTEGVKPNPDKIVAIKKFPIPKTQKEIKSFLGLLGDYRRFTKDFAKITKPLTACLKKNATVNHTTDVKNSFNHCKSLLINSPISQYPDFTKPFTLTTDAKFWSVKFGQYSKESHHKPHTLFFVAYANSTTFQAGAPRYFQLEFPSDSYSYLYYVTLEPYLKDFVVIRLAYSLHLPISGDDYDEFTDINLPENYEYKAIMENDLQCIMTKFKSKEDVEKWIVGLQALIKETWTIEKTFKVPTNAPRNVLKRICRCHFKTSIKNKGTETPEHETKCKKQALRQRPLGDEARSHLIELFNRGHSSASAYRTFCAEKMEVYGDNYESILYDRFYMPTKNDVANLWKKKFKEDFDKRTSSHMLEN
ncbi:hypothetical protein HUJ04_003243 [Dendroctonus ponderosae]|nr:hypothetical protein HUJ04_003243 [Dendroctonus ponderosae]